MQKFAKLYAIPAGLIFLKILVTLRTAVDTYHVSNDVLDVLLIDVAYLVLWSIAAYAGNSQQALYVRPFAAAGAWGLYLLALSIAWQAGVLTGTQWGIVVSLIARVAGIILLALDTWSYIVALMQHQKQSQADWKVTLRNAVSSVAYIIGALLTLPFALLVNIYVAARDYVTDVKPSSVTSKTVKPSVNPKHPNGQQNGKVFIPDKVDNAIRKVYSQDENLTPRQIAKSVGKISHTTVRNRIAKWPDWYREETASLPKAP